MVKSVTIQAKKIDMINSGILDIIIGLVFIYLLYSLLATIIQEIISSHFGFMCKMLERAIIRMLEDENKFDSKFSSIFFLFKKSGNGGKRNSVSGTFYRHPLIKFLGENNSRSKPAYLNRDCFSKVMVDLLRGENVKPGDDVKSLIQNSLNDGKLNWGGAGISDETLSFLNSIWADAQADAFVKAHPDLDIMLMEKEFEYKKAMVVIQKTDSAINTSSTNTVIKDSLELEKYKLLKARRDTLLSRAESLIKKDIKSVQHSLGMEW